MHSLDRLYQDLSIKVYDPTFDDHWSFNTHENRTQRKLNAAANRKHSKSSSRHEEDRMARRVAELLAL